MSRGKKYDLIFSFVVIIYKLFACIAEIISNCVFLRLEDIQWLEHVVFEFHGNEFLTSGF